MAVNKRKPKSSLAKLKAKWESILTSEGLTPEPPQIPHWHRSSPALAAMQLKGRSYHTGITVRLPSDDNGNPSVADRTLITAVNRKAAEVINSRLSDWVWRLCDWTQYPKIDRIVMELHVVEGWFKSEIAAHTKLDQRKVTRILTRHRALAGV